MFAVIGGIPTHGVEEEGSQNEGFAGSSLPFGHLPRRLLFWRNYPNKQNPSLLLRANRKETNLRVPRGQPSLQNSVVHVYRRTSLRRVFLVVSFQWGNCVLPGRKKREAYHWKDVSKIGKDNLINMFLYWLL